MVQDNSRASRNTSSAPSAEPTKVQDTRPTGMPTGSVPSQQKHGMRAEPRSDQGAKRDIRHTGSAPSQYAYRERAAQGARRASRDMRSAPREQIHKDRAEPEDGHEGHQAKRHTRIAASWKAHRELDYTQGARRARVHRRSAPRRKVHGERAEPWLLYTSPSPRDRTRSRMPSSA